VIQVAVHHVSQGNVSTDEENEVVSDADGYFSDADVSRISDLFFLSSFCIHCAHIFVLMCNKCTISDRKAFLLMKRMMFLAQLMRTFHRLK